MCKPLPSPLSAAIAEAKRRCDGYQLCENFAIDTDHKAFKDSSSFKFFVSVRAQSFGRKPLMTAHKRDCRCAAGQNWAVLRGRRLAYVAEGQAGLKHGAACE